MARSLNRIELIGNLTRDPDLKTTPSGSAVCSFGIATNRTWTDASGVKKEDTQFHRIVAWQKLGELAQKLLRKGSKVYVEGRITYREFTDKNGQQRSITEVVLNDFVLMENKSQAEEGEITPEAAHTSSKHENNQDVAPEDIPF